jgi:hypothetical protein
MQLFRLEYAIFRFSYDVMTSRFLCAVLVEQLLSVWCAIGKPEDDLLMSKRLVLNTAYYYCYNNFQLH